MTKKRDRRYARRYCLRGLDEALHMLRSARIGLFVAAVAVFLAAIVLTVRWAERPELPEGLASANGRLEATQVDVATERAGRLDEVTVREGDVVQQGAVVARMDTSSLEAELRHANAQLRVAEEAMHVAEANVAQQESAVEFAAAEFRRSESLVGQRLVSQQQLDLDRSRLRSERAGLNAARAAVSQAVAAIAAAQANIDAIETRLRDSILKAPATGCVLYRLAEPGEVLPAGGKVVTLIDRSNVHMTGFLPTRQAGRIGVGSEARIVLDARPETVLPARIVFISPEAQFTPKEVETASEREKLVFRVKASLNPHVLESCLGSITTGVPGMLYVRLNPEAEWPEGLRTPPDGE